MSTSKIRVALSLAVAFVAIEIPSVHAGTISLSSKEYGDKWPFTVNSVTLSCRNTAAVLIQTSNGTTYWLNGKASTQFKQLPSWREIAKPDPRYSDGKKMTVPNDMIKRGLDLCK